MLRQDKAGQDKAIARQYNHKTRDRTIARQENHKTETRQDKTRQDKTRQDKTTRTKDQDQVQDKDQENNLIVLFVHHAAIRVLCGTDKTKHESMTRHDKT